jgi:hypothetical protein
MLVCVCVHIDVSTGVGIESFSISTGWIMCVTNCVPCEIGLHPVSHTVWKHSAAPAVNGQCALTT